MTPTTTLKLDPSGKIPLVGFGTFRLKDDECRNAVATALELGYRHLDTADVYGNEESVGQGIATSGVPRDQIFLTTKVWRDNLSFDGVCDSCERSLQKLRTDYLDLLLVHWPNNATPMEETFRAMADLIDRGRIRACGVSNFTAARLDRAIDLDLVPIAVNQVEYHPLLNQKELHRHCREKGVVLTAYSPLAQGKIAEDALLKSIGRKYGKSPAQVALRWLLQREIVVIPKASSRERIEENLAVFDFELSPADFRAVDDRDEWVRLIAWEVAEFDR